MYIVVTCSTLTCDNPAETYVEDGEDQGELFDSPVLCDGCIDRMCDEQRAAHGHWEDF